MRRRPCAILGAPLTSAVAGFCPSRERVRFQWPIMTPRELALVRSRPDHLTPTCMHRSSGNITHTVAAVPATFSPSGSYHGRHGGPHEGAGLRRRRPAFDAVYGPGSPPGAGDRCCRTGMWADRACRGPVRAIGSVSTVWLGRAPEASRVPPNQSAPMDRAKAPVSGASLGVLGS